MKTIDINDIVIYSSILGYGSFSINKECIYNNKHFSFKIFDESENIFDSNLEEKYQKMDKNLNLQYSSLPKYIVIKDNYRVGYLTEILKEFSFCKVKSLEKRISILNQIKNGIIELHQNNIIHTDIHSGNILYDSECKNFKLIDFDNCVYEDFKVKKQCFDENAYDFIKKFGLCKELDIYMFNLLTYSEMEEVNISLSKRLIENGYYGIFDDEISKKICDSLTLYSDNYTDKFLVDSVNIEKIKKIDYLNLY